MRLRHSPLFFFQSTRGLFLVGFFCFPSAIAPSKARPRLHRSIERRRRRRRSRLSGMQTCNHWIPISPFLRPHICSSKQRFVTPDGKFIRSHLRNPEIDIFWRLWRRGVRVGVFSRKDEHRAGDNAPLEGFVKKRKIVEHILLLQAKVDLSDVDEKDMLDFLYTSQYHISGIIAISLGCVEDPNMYKVTHAVYMRFQRREDLARFKANPHFVEVLKEHVFPYCYGLFSVNFESEVDDDMLSIFRRGENFNYGVECILLISVFEASLLHAIEDAMLALQNLMDESSSLIVQGTCGSNFSCGDSEYTHAAVMRFRTFEAFELFRCSSKYQYMWKSKFQPIIRKSIFIHFSVDPVGTELL